MKESCPSEGLEFHILPIAHCQSINPRRPLVVSSSVLVVRTASPQLCIHEKCLLFTSFLYTHRQNRPNKTERPSGVKSLQLGLQLWSPTVDPAVTGWFCLRQSGNRESGRGRMKRFTPRFTSPSTNLSIYTPQIIAILNKT